MDRAFGLDFGSSSGISLERFDMLLPRLRGLSSDPVDDREGLPRRQALHRHPRRTFVHPSSSLWHRHRRRRRSRHRGQPLPSFSAVSSPRSAPGCKADVAPDSALLVRRGRSLPRLPRLRSRARRSFLPQVLGQAPPLWQGQGPPASRRALRRHRSCPACARDDHPGRGCYQRRREGALSPSVPCNQACCSRSRLSCRSTRFPRRSSSS